MQKREIFALPHYGRYENAEAITARIAEMFHPKAKKEFCRDDSTVELIQLWLRKRLERLGIEKNRGGAVSLTLNPYNESDLLGLQSVSVALQEQVRAGQPLEEILSNCEWKSPTVGVVADGLIEPPFQITEARFEVDKEKGEAIQSCSRDLRIDGEEGGDIRTLNAGNSILVTGPRAVRTYLQMGNASPEQVCRTVNRGVYICSFVKTGRRRLIDDTDTTAIIE